MLTPRDKAVVGSVLQGLTNREIARRLKLTEHTVKNYLFRIFEKLGVSSRVEVVLYALGGADARFGASGGRRSQPGAGSRKSSAPIPITAGKPVN